MPPPPTFDVRLARARMLSPNVRELRFERVDRAPFEFQAGQWVSLVLPLAEGEARRAYSIASPPDGSPSFEVAITRVDGGPGSTHLHELELGRTLRAIGPQGFFTRPPASRGPALFVGTGTGVTPLRSMIRDALASGDASPMTLLFGVRREEDRLYLDELEALEKAHPHFRAIYTLSRGGPSWGGFTGYVQTHVESLWRALAVADPSQAPHVYVCGLERMVGAVRDLLRKQMGLERKLVHSERYD
ncbi:MAG: FAD-dependent oxidoreductase [Labilithrix sp.]|nr:FAD-dependent oxidoreductase [Labilithrix sp.]